MWGQEDKAPRRLALPLTKSSLGAFLNKPALNDLPPLTGKYLQRDGRIQMGFWQRQQVFPRKRTEGPASRRQKPPLKGLCARVPGVHAAGGNNPRVSDEDRVGTPTTQTKGTQRWSHLVAPALTKEVSLRSARNSETRGYVTTAWTSQTFFAMSLTPEEHESPVPDHAPTARPAGATISPQERTLSSISQVGKARPELAE